MVVSSSQQSTAEADALRRCSAAISGGRPQEAERIARELLTRQRGHRQALHALGVALLMQRRPSEALAPLEEAARDGGSPEVETHLGLALRDLGRQAEALTWLERAAARKPPFVPAFVEFGTLLRTMRRFDEAERVLRRGLILAPTNPVLPMLLGGVHLDRGRAADAKAAFSRALVQAPSHPDALMGLAVASQYEGDFAKAAGIYRQILSRADGHVRARLNLGYCLLELGQEDEGIATMRELVRKNPQAYRLVLRMLVAAGRGRFWLKRKTAAEQLGFEVPAKKAG